MKFLPKIIGFFVNFLSYISPKLAGKLAIYLFSTPLKGKPTEKDIDFLNTAFRESLKYDDLSIMTYRWLGKNKTILLAHGWESNAARWRPLIESLKKHDYNIIALDAPAHGHSGSKRFDAILYAEFIQIVCKKFKPDVIVGHSVGGMSTIFYQHKYKNKQLEKLILLGAPSNISDVFTRYINMMGYNKRVGKQMNKIVQQKYGNLPAYYSAANFTKNIDTSALIIHDERDRIIPYEDAKQYVENYQNAKLITTQGFGHSLNNETITEYINNYLSKEAI
ncbi:TAP-like protein [Oceanihabitans sediminis]|uniref:Alpha/beta hydrolase n=1 Tax=Oceanihabitans sediminis TaxID=1812012 RepID=A0A368P3Y1_9FLAO|nr:alpha/beta hydrolase [Oceanihabitans sediminis]MDX1774317.1 alpha/beta hydrolase [Oceanihabitans sediminis]RBP29881.1 TAP-like protein [Oceanihabitans sediminis]RCU57218.1 alpha/beta hydrolase [Oceanihabitans sediminis]